MRVYSITYVVVKSLIARYAPQRLADLSNHKFCFMSRKHHSEHHGQTAAEEKTDARERRQHGKRVPCAGAAQSSAVRAAPGARSVPRGGLALRGHYGDLYPAHQHVRRPRA